MVKEELNNEPHSTGLLDFEEEENIILRGCFIWVKRYLKSHFIHHLLFHSFNKICISRPRTEVRIALFMFSYIWFLKIHNLCVIMASSFRYFPGGNKNLVFRFQLKVRDIQWRHFTLVSNLEAQISVCWF